MTDERTPPMLNRRGWSAVLSAFVWLVAVPLPAQDGIAIVRLRPLPVESAPDPSGKLVTIEWITPASDGSWTIDFEVLEWIKSPPIAKNGDVTRRFDRTEWVVSPIVYAQMYQNQLLVMEIAAKNGRLVGGKFWPTNSNDKDAVVKRELTGWNSIARIRGLSGAERKVKAFSEIAGAATDPSLLVVLESRKILDLTDKEDEQRILAKVLTGIMLGEKTALYVRHEASLELRRIAIASPTVQSSVNLDTFSELVKFFHGLVLAGGTQPDVEYLTLRNIDRYFQNVISNSAAAGSIEQLRMDIRVYRRAIELRNDEVDQSRLDLIITLEKALGK